jgi:hypothetical protein
MLPQPDKEKAETDKAYHRMKIIEWVVALKPSRQVFLEIRDNVAA